MGQCVDCGSDKVEASGRCASCNHLQRKIARESAKPKKSYHIPKVSQKRMVDQKTYSKRRASYLKKYPYCQLKLEGCTNIATQIHHTAGRIASNLTNTNTFKSTCDNCHKQLHNKLSAKDRREKGFLKTVHTNKDSHKKFED